MDLVYMRSFRRCLSCPSGLDKFLSPPSPLANFEQLKPCQRTQPPVRRMCLVVLQRKIGKEFSAGLKNSSTIRLAGSFLHHLVRTHHGSLPAVLKSSVLLISIYQKSIGHNRVHISNNRLRPNCMYVMRGCNTA